MCRDSVGTFASSRFFHILLGTHSFNVPCPQDANHYQQICSSTRAPTLHRVIPVLETLASRWEAKMQDPKYAPFHNALEKGLAKLVKYYKRLDNARAYILALCTRESFSHWYLLTSPSL